MRCFVGLDIQAKQKLVLQSWCNNALPEVRERERSISAKSSKAPRAAALPFAVPPANYHITLCFLGNINVRQHERLIPALEEIRSQPFSLLLDQSGFWNGPKIVLVQPGEIPDALIKLEKDVRKAVREAGIETENRDYRPHVTVVRKANANLPPPLFAPDVHCQFTEFHLFESVSGKQGVYYPVRNSWPLQGTLSKREQLRQGLV